ncbi:MAG: PRC-barrel domain-containing protein [Xanthobacteraceae bacterium]
MLRKFMVSAAASALMISGAMAQADAPRSDTPSAQSQQHSTAGDSLRFIQAQGADQFVFSKFKGTDVLGPDNAKVGDVSDVLFDKNGKVLGLIVGVGGFLGIGEKSVAIDMNAFQVVPASTSSSSSNSSSTSTSRDEDPTNVKLKVTWTKDQLKSAPDFQYYKSSSRTSSTSPNSNTTGMAPRNAPATPSTGR